jgi:hypothetical protein
MDPTTDGLEIRNDLAPRFAAFQSGDLSLLGDTTWLATTSGTARQELDLHGTRIAVVSINTAWLAQGGGDRHEMTPGLAMVEQALDDLDDANLILLLGHHPIDWWRDADVQSLTSLFARLPLVYCHGHMHRSQARHEWAANTGFLSLQAGAAFQERDNEQWVNGFLECAYAPTERSIHLYPWR